MKNCLWSIVIFTVCLTITTDESYGQSWNLVKEKDGIRIFTRKDSNSSLKSYKAETTFRADLDKLSLIIGNAKQLDWWDKNISEIKVLASEENVFTQFYLVYDVPWPLANRDLVVDARISTNTVTGERIIVSKPLLNVIPEKPGLVRIKKYWQKWTIQPAANGNVHLSLEGFVDPGGNVPAWLYNIFITETPFEVMKAIREKTFPGIPASLK